MSSVCSHLLAYTHTEGLIDHIVRSVLTAPQQGSRYDFFVAPDPFVRCRANVKISLLWGRYLEQLPAAATSQQIMRLFPRYLISK